MARVRVVSRVFPSIPSQIADKLNVCIQQQGEQQHCLFDGRNVADAEVGEGRSGVCIAAAVRRDVEGRRRGCWLCLLSWTTFVSISLA